MSYFPDLSAYAYGYRAHPGVVHVGWLDNVHSFPRGTVAVALIEKMKQLAAKPVELYRGLHICELCAEPPALMKPKLPNRLVIDPHCSWAQWLTKDQATATFEFLAAELRLLLLS
jgi:hypothetical protein